MTSHREGEGGKAIHENRAEGLGHKCVTEGGRGLNIVLICVTSFLNDAKGF